MESLKVGPNNRAAIASIAESLRRRAEIAEPPFSTRRIIDLCFPGTMVTGRKLPDGVDDVVHVDEAAFRSHRAPHVIVYRRGMSTAQQRFAIAHALGHIIFDGAAPRRCGEYHRDRELRCDRFAEELLVPIDLLKPHVCVWPGRAAKLREAYLDLVDQLASRFHVPSPVIDKRIRELRRS